MYFLLSSMAIAAPCLVEPTKACLIHKIEDSAALRSPTSTDTSVAIQGILTTLDPARADALKTALQRRHGDADLAYFNLTQIAVSFGDAPTATSYLERIPPNQPFHYQAALSIRARFSPDRITDLVHTIPAELPAREVVVQQAVDLLLQAHRVEEATRIARTLPTTQADSFFGVATRDSALMKVLLDHLAHNREAAARKLQGELTDPALADRAFVYASSQSKAAVDAQIKTARTLPEPHLRNRALNTLAQALLDVGQFDPIDRVLGEVLPQEYGSTQEIIIRHYLQRLATLGRWNDLQKAYDHFPVELRGDAVYPLMIAALAPPIRSPPTAKQTNFARRIVRDTSGSFSGYQESLALGLLAAALP